MAIAPTQAVFPPAVPTAAAPTTAPGNAISSLSNNFETFLTLLMTQLQNQDPTNPLDTNEFTSQLVQFASVEQQIATNRSLGQLIDLTQSGQVLQSSAMVGRRVEVESDRLSLQNGSATVKFTSATDAPATVLVYNSGGTKVAETMVPATAGSNEWTWNGRNSSGTLLRDGVYTVAVLGSNGDGSAKALPFSVLGTATGVEQKDKAIKLKIGDLTVDFTKVKAVVPLATQ